MKSGRRHGLVNCPCDTGHSPCGSLRAGGCGCTPAGMTQCNQPPAEADFSFEAPVSVQCDRHRIVIADARQAHACLLEQFSIRTAPSYLRALRTCEAFLAGSGRIAGVEATFVVAVMEAGFPFEVQDIDLRLLQSELEAPSHE